VSEEITREILVVADTWKRCFPEQPPQHYVFIRSWLRYADMDTVIQWIEYAAECHNKVSTLRNPGAWITSRINPRTN
jgi:hypothetical protein